MLGDKMCINIENVTVIIFRWYVWLLVIYPGDSTKKILKLNSVRKPVTVWIYFLFMKNKEALQLKYIIHHSKDEYKGKGTLDGWGEWLKAQSLYKISYGLSTAVFLRKTRSEDIVYLFRDNCKYMKINFINEEN